MKYRTMYKCLMCNALIRFKAVEIQPDELPSITLAYLNSKNPEYLTHLHKGGSIGVGVFAGFTPVKE